MEFECIWAKVHSWKTIDGKYHNCHTVNIVSKQADFVGKHEFTPTKPRVLFKDEASPIPETMDDSSVPGFFDVSTKPSGSKNADKCDNCDDSAVQQKDLSDSYTSLETGLISGFSVLAALVFFCMVSSHFIE